MTTTLHLADVAVVEELAEALTKRLLEPRDKRLHGRAPRDPHVHQLRRSIACGKAKPMMMLLTVLFADMEDGIPAQALLPFLDELREVLIVRGAPTAYTPTKTLRTLLLNEARRQAERDQVEIELRYDPNNEALKRRFLEATARYEEANQALTAVVSRDAALIQQRFPRTADVDYAPTSRPQAVFV